MKPFNLEQALAGAPVQTRDGRPVTQLTHFDLGDKIRVVGVVNGEILRIWYPGGCVINTDCEDGVDLFMAPVKKTGWVAITKDVHVYSSEELAKLCNPDALSYHEISWDE